MIARGRTAVVATLLLVHPLGMAAVDPPETPITPSDSPVEHTPAPPLVEPGVATPLASLHPDPDGLVRVELVVRGGAAVRVELARESDERFAPSGPSGPSGTAEPGSRSTVGDDGGVAELMTRRGDEAWMATAFRTTAADVVVAALDGADRLRIGIRPGVPSVTRPVLSVLATLVDAPPGDERVGAPRLALSAGDALRFELSTVGAGPAPDRPGAAPHPPATGGVRRDVWRFVDVRGGGTLVATLVDPAADVHLSAHAGDAATAPPTGELDASVRRVPARPGPDPTTVVLRVGQLDAGPGNRVEVLLRVEPPDRDGDGVPDAEDGCPDDALKTAPGACGCHEPEVDRDGDGTPDCTDGCPDDPGKTEPGACGCGAADRDGDGDGVPDCLDRCPDDPLKIEPGWCGCGEPESDQDGDGVPDCIDNCPRTWNPDQRDDGADGVGDACTDRDGDGVPDAEDGCPDTFDPDQSDDDGDGVGDACDACPGMADLDSDGDGVADCVDRCPGDDHLDCDGDGEPDGCAIARRPELDRDEDGELDSCACAADLTDDGVVDGLDLAMLLQLFNQGVRRADLDHDGLVDGDDVGVLVGSWGPCPLPGNDVDLDTVPDPSDNCPNVPNPLQQDRNGNGVGDACEDRGYCPAVVTTDCTPAVDPLADDPTWTRRADATPLSAPRKDAAPLRGGPVVAAVRIGSAFADAVGCQPEGGVADRSALVARVPLRGAFRIEVELDRIPPGAEPVTVVFVDWNRNGVFTDAGERTALTGVPAAAFLHARRGTTEGPTRLRVRTALTRPPACGATADGAVVDYTVDLR